MASKKAQKIQCVSAEEMDGANHAPRNDDDASPSRNGLQPGEIANERITQTSGGITKAPKRSCNNCRQQKLRCDVIASPFYACSRCQRLGKSCKVETDFKRVGKRDKYAKMQGEIDRLRRQVQIATDGNAHAGNQALPPAPITEPLPALIHSTRSRRLGEVSISGKTLDDLYSHFFAFHHKFLPLLDPESNPDRCFELSPLLGWSIVMVAARRFPQKTLLSALTADFLKLLWSTIADPPQPYHTVKALCLVCFWPLPTSKDFKDQTFQLCGLMFQSALQHVLHLPSKAQFPFEKQMGESEQRDRLITWAACNIVAQSVSTTFGQPPQTMYDWVLGSDFRLLEPYTLPKDLVDHLRISHFCDAAAKTLYCDKSEASGLIPAEDRPLAMELLNGRYVAIKETLGDRISALNEIHLLAASQHLTAFAFFLPRVSPQRDAAFLSFYNATCAFVQGVMDYETSLGGLLEHCSILISQTIFSSAFALLKLLNSPFASRIDVDHGKTLFHSTMLAARTMSLQDGDVASRTATRVPGLWRDLGAGAPWSASKPDPLLLNVQFRMSVSHVFDCYWSWLERFKARETLAPRGEATKSGPSESMSSTLPHSNIDPGMAMLTDAPFPEVNMADFDLSNIMDWMTWTDLPPGPYDFDAA